MVAIFTSSFPPKTYLAFGSTPYSAFALWSVWICELWSPFPRRELWPTPSTRGDHSRHDTSFRDTYSHESTVTLPRIFIQASLHRDSPCNFHSYFVSKGRLAPIYVQNSTPLQTTRARPYVAWPLIDPQWGHGPSIPTFSWDPPAFSILFYAFYSFFWIFLDFFIFFPV
jgi:hypothetical protein